MSRLGKKPVSIPSGVDVKLDGRTVTVSKSDKTLTYEHRPEVSVEVDTDAKEVRVSIPENKLQDKQTKAYWGLTRSLLQNMMEGVTTGYKKQLEVVGVGYTAKMGAKGVDLKCGTANTVTIAVPPTVSVSIENQIITVEGHDKQLVGQTASKIKAVRKPEPYNGKGIKYVGEQIIRKQGKAFGS